MRKASRGVSPDIYRVIDVNLNRAREGLRVIEDTFRFVCRDRRLTRSVRSARHRLAGVAAGLYQKLIVSRNIRRDFGKKNTEKKYGSAKGMITANFRRVGEALRVLEEYSRLVAPKSGKQFKEIRFRIYSIEKKHAAEFFKGQY